MFFLQKVNKEHSFEYEKMGEHILRKEIYAYSFNYKDVYYYCPSLLSYAEACAQVKSMHDIKCDNDEKTRWDNDWKSFLAEINENHITNKEVMVRVASRSTAIFNFLTIDVAKEIISSHYFDYDYKQAYGHPRSNYYIKGEFDANRNYVDRKYRIKVFANPDRLDFTGVGFGSNYRQLEKLNIYMSYDFKCVNSDNEKERYYMLEDLNADDVRHLKNLFMEHGLFVTYDLMKPSEHVYEPALDRPFIPAKYRCAYCGRLFVKSDITVDHIYPVAKMVASEKVRNAAARHGITETNDLNNLVAACARCNEKKSDKMGLWVYRGLFGRNELNWKILFSIIGLIIVAAAVVLVKTFIWPTIGPILTGENGPLITFFAVISISSVIVINNKEKLEFL